jgi:hypothetical protein
MRAKAAPAAEPTPDAPWYLWCATFAVLSAMIGVHWDISWHRSIGRDTFWTAPHMAIYLCGVLGGISAAYLILSTTFGRGTKDASVRVFGFRGPLGAFIVAWGGIAMLTSAPFDDWWHNAYGLDVKIISPPHTLLSMGIFSVQIGALILVLGFMNRAEGAARRRLQRMFLFIGGMTLVMLTVFLMEHTDRSQMHSGAFYMVLAIAIPIALVGIGRAADHPWACTIMAAVYSLLQLGFLWVFPLFPAQPKLGPVYFPVTHFVPPPFPILLIVPALGIDFLRARKPDWGAWRLSLAAGATFLVLLLAAQWPFAEFLQLPAARNWVFGTHYFDYNTRPMWSSFNYRFANWEEPAERRTHFLIAIAAALVGSRIGLAWGAWMRQIRR